MKRTHVSLLPEDFEALRRIAARKKTTVSELLRQGVRSELEAERASRDKMWGIVGLGEGADPDGSVRHDEILYGH